METAAELETAAGHSSVAVVLVPLPAQGHLNQHLHIARLLLSRPGISVHYASTAAHTRQARMRSTAATNTKIHFHDLPVRTFATPPPDPTAHVKFPSHLQPLFDATADMELPLANLLRSLSAHHRRVVLIHDGSMSFVAAAAVSVVNVETFMFDSISAYAAMSFLDSCATSFSFEGCFTAEFAAFVRRQRRLREATSGHLINTCRATEGRFIDMLAQQTGWKDRFNFAIGPLNPIQVDRSGHLCMEWLDRQPDDSVIYVSFGTMSSLPDEQVRQLADGLADSWQRFIWVVRHADRGDIFSTAGGRPELPEGYERTVKGRGQVVTGWAPQLEILAHKATGGFLTHCGWNSCTEGMSMGVPMLTWPMHSDQPKNAELVTKWLGIGMMGREWERRGEVIMGDVIRESIVKLMEGEEGREVRQRARELGEMMREVARHNETSKSELGSFIDYITRST